MSDLITKAIEVAVSAHAGQVRKYSNIPYITHPFAVAGLVASIGGTEDMVAIAILHDVVEDSDVTVEQLEAEFGYEISYGVWCLSDVSKLEDGNRAFRKAMDREHIRKASSTIKTIKLADLIDNTSSIMACDPKFAEVYMAEKAQLLRVLQDGDPILLALATELVEGYYSKCA